MEPTLAETCFIHCVNNYTLVNIQLMLASINQIYFCWILLLSVLIFFFFFAGEWLYQLNEFLNQVRLILLYKTSNLSFQVYDDF